MTYRDFPQMDSATASNLRRLEHLADEDGAPGDFDLIDGMIIAIINSIKRLPPAISKHFNIYDYAIGDAYVDVSRARRLEIWKRLTGRLTVCLDAVAGDQSLVEGGDLGERDPTRGERLEEICRQLEAAFSRGGDVEDLVKQLGLQAEGTSAAADAREIKRHISMKRIPDVSKWRAEIFSLIAHAERIASELHHKAAR